MQTWHSRVFFALSLLLLLACFVSEFILVSQGSSFLQSYDSIPDDVLFFLRAEGLFSAIRDLNLTAIRQFGTPYGYGLPFWLTAAGAAGGLPDPRQSWSGFAPPKLLFLLLKWFPVWGLALFLAKRRGLVAAALFCLTFLGCSAFAFYGKVLSPEPVLLALGALSMACAAEDDLRLGRWMHGAVVCAVLATFTKLTALPLLVSMFVLIAIGSWNQRRFVPVVAYSGSALAAAVSCLLSCLSSEGWKSYTTWNAAIATRTFQLPNVGLWLTSAGQTWELLAQSGARGFLGLLAATLSVGVALLSRERKTSKIPVVFFSAGAAGLFVTVGTSGYLDWYLWPTALMIAFSSALAHRAPSFPTGLMLLLLSFLTLCCSIPETARRVEMRKMALREMTRSDQAASLDDSLHCPSDAVILTDLFVGLAPDSHPSTRVIRVRDAVTLSGNEVPVDVKYFLASPTALVRAASPDLPALREVTHIVVNDHLAGLGSSPLVNLAGVHLSPDRQIASMNQSSFKRVNLLDGLALYESIDFSCKRTSQR